MMLSVVIILLMVSVVLSAETLCITPSSQCVENSTNESCLILSQVAAKPKRYFTDNTTLKLLPGYHVLDSQLVVRNISNLTVFAPSYANVTCGESGRFVLEGILTVYIRDIHFTGCGGNNVTLVDHFIVDNCHFCGLRYTTTNHPLVIRGIHLHLVSLANVTRSIFSSYNNSLVLGRAHGSFVLTLNIVSCLFQNNVAHHGSTIQAHGISIIKIDNSTFHNNIAVHKGGASVNDIDAVSFITIKNSMFTSNDAILNGAIQSSVVLGAALSCYYSASINIVSCLFQNNIADYGSAILAVKSNITIENSVFCNNEAHQQGGAIHALVSNNNAVTIKNSIFTNNTAFLGGTVYSISDERIGGSIMIENSTFISNVAEFSGGAVYLESIRNITMIRTRVINSTAKSYGGAFCLQFSSFISSEFLEIENSQGGVGVVYAIQTEVMILGTNVMSNNCGSFLFIGSNVTFQGNTDFLYSREHGCSDQTTLELQQGGAVTVFNSDIRFEGETNFTGNQADNGGAIFAFQSTLYMYGEITLSHNRALLSGGGIYAYQSELRLRGTNTISNNTADNEGGGIHAIGSTTGLLQGALYLTRNNASHGGGMFLESNAKLYILKNTSELLTSDRENWRSIKFEENSADYGGAIYVNDSTNSGVCASITSRLRSTATTECFLQTYTYSFNSADQINLQNVNFIDNSATSDSAGDSLYGGLLDRCTINPLSEISRLLQNHPTNLTIDKTNGGIFTMSDIEEDAIASDPVRVCFCNGGQPDCSYQPDTVRIRKGEKFVLPVVALNQLGRPTPSRIHSSLQSQGGTFSEGQLLQNTSKNCTELEYNIFSPHDSEQLLLYAEGPCRNIGMSQCSINVTFLPCDCPIGFERLNATQTNCSCVCDPPIRSFVSDCFIETESIVRQGNFWITYINSSLLNKTGYIVYEHCPFDYCFPSTTLVNINLNIPDGSDEQCAFNRSGILCGSCQEGLSLSLGSSRCMPCSNHWLALLIPFAIAGVVLVAFILVFDLIVAVGTINGLIFFANIVAAKRTLFLPFEGVNIFITWLNLDFGFETCLYEGMDGYAKVWLQLVFPAYIILMVAMVILISENSRSFSRLVFRINRNPVAVLATLILLSYTKLLRAIIAALSFTTLQYPDGSHETVWLYDANIPYLEGKHIPLFIAALLILFIGVTFTLLLFLWQWLLKLEHYTNWRILKWCNNTRLHSFMDVYHAPHNKKTRYWTGLLLLARVLLYIVSSLDHVIGDARVNLLSTICVVGGLLLLKEIQRDKTYKEHVNNLFESCFIFNLLIFASATYQFRETNEDQTVIAFISICIAFITFVAVLFYHSYLLFKRHIGSLSKFKCCKICCVNANPLIRRAHTDSDPSVILQFVNSDSSLLEELLPAEYIVSEIDGVPTIHADDSDQDSLLDSMSNIESHKFASDEMTCSSDLNDQSKRDCTQVKVRAKTVSLKKHKCINIGHPAHSQM